jgi:hypothetical protein
MNYWLKLIGSSDRPVTGEPWHGRFDETTIGFRKQGRPSIQAGDHLFLYAPGGSKRIFATAEVVTDPEQDANYDPSENGSCRWKIHIRYLINLQVESGISIDQASLPTRALANSVKQQSHIKLSTDEYKHIHKRLEERTASTMRV